MPSVVTSPCVPARRPPQLEEDRAGRICQQSPGHTWETAAEYRDSLKDWRGVREDVSRSGIWASSLLTLLCLIQIAFLGLQKVQQPWNQMPSLHPSPPDCGMTVAAKLVPHTVPHLMSSPAPHGPSLVLQPTLNLELANCPSDLRSLPGPSSALLWEPPSPGVQGTVSPGFLVVFTNRKH